MNGDKKMEKRINRRSRKRELKRMKGKNGKINTENIEKMHTNEGKNENTQEINKGKR